MSHEVTVSQEAWGTLFKDIPSARECPAAALEGMPEHLLQEKEQSLQFILIINPGYLLFLHFGYFI